MKNNVYSKYAFLSSFVVLSLVWGIGCSSKPSSENTEVEAVEQSNSIASRELSEQNHSIVNFPSRWAALSQISDGLVVYYRNKSISNTVVIESDTLKKVGLNETVSWPIRSFKKTGENVYIFDLGNKDTNSVFARDQWEILDKDTLLAIMTWEIVKLDNKGEETILGDGKQLMIPFESIDLFKQVHETNLKTPESSFEFKEIDFVQIRNRKTR